mgnify:CR=1 FL=1
MSKISIIVLMFLSMFVASAHELWCDLQCSECQEQKCTHVSREIKAMTDIMDIFEHIIANKVFPCRTVVYWGQEIDSFFYDKSPDRLKKYKDKISFAGEFLRFLRTKIITDKPFASVAIKPITGPSLNFRTLHGKRNSPVILIHKDDSASVFEFIVALTSVKRHKQHEQDKFWTSAYSHGYFHVVGVILKNGQFQMEFSFFISNQGLPLQHSKEPSLSSLSPEIITQFQDWLITQEENYMAL